MLTAPKLRELTQKAITNSSIEVSNKFAAALT